MKNVKHIGIFLDDERFPEDVTWVTYPDNIEWRRCRTFYDFEVIIDEILFDADNQRSNIQVVVSFDHDLGVCPGSGEILPDGKDCMNLMCEKLLDNPEFKLPMCFVHSKNPVGKENIASYWQSFQKHHLFVSSLGAEGECPDEVDEETDD